MTQNYSIVIMKDPQTKCKVYSSTVSISKKFFFQREVMTKTAKSFSQQQTESATGEQDGIQSDIFN